MLDWILWRTATIWHKGYRTADTAGVMREVDGGYIYNLEVPTKVKNSDGSFTELKAGDLLTVRVRPFGDDQPEASMYVVLKVAK